MRFREVASISVPCNLTIDKVGINQNEDRGFEMGVVVRTAHAHVAAWLALLLVQAEPEKQSTKLVFDQRGQFKIAQFADRKHLVPNYYRRVQYGTCSRYIYIIPSSSLRGGGEHAMGPSTRRGKCLTPLQSSELPSQSLCLRPELDESNGARVGVGETESCGLFWRYIHTCISI